MPDTRSFINYQDAQGFTPLHCAAELGHDAVTKQLIAGRCNVDLQNDIGCTPLTLLALYGCMGMHPSSSSSSGLHVSVIKLLLAVRCNVHLQDKSGRTALQVAELPDDRQLHGRTGTAVTFDNDKGHYSVAIDGTSSSLLIKPCNLSPMVCQAWFCVSFFHI